MINAEAVKISNVCLLKDRLDSFLSLFRLPLSLEKVIILLREISRIHVTLRIIVPITIHILQKHTHTCVRCSY